MFLNTAATYSPRITSYLETGASKISRLLIADQVVPKFGVAKQKDSFITDHAETSGDLTEFDVPDRAPNAGYEEITTTFGTDSYATKEKGLEHSLGDVDAATLDDYMNTESVATKRLERVFKKWYEKQVKNFVFDATLPTVTPTASYTIANKATLTPQDDILKAINQMSAVGELPKICVMAQSLWDYLRTCPKFAEFFYGSTNGGKGVTAAMFKEHFKVDLILGNLYLDATKKIKNDTISTTPIWPTSHIAFLDNTGGDLTAGGFGRALYWTKDTPSFWVGETYRKEATRSTVIRMRTNHQLKLLNKRAARLIVTSSDVV